MSRRLFTAVLLGPSVLFGDAARADFVVPAGTTTIVNGGPNGVPYTVFGTLQVNSDTQPSAITNYGFVNVLNPATLDVSGGIQNMAGGYLFVSCCNVTGFTGNVNNAGTVQNLGNFTGDVLANTGPFVGIPQHVGWIDNEYVWTGNVVSNAAIIVNNRWWNGNVISNSGEIENLGDWNGHVTNSGLFINYQSGQLVMTTFYGLLIAPYTGNIFGGLTNTGTFIGYGGVVNGAIANLAGGTFSVFGNVSSDGSFANASGGTLQVGSGGHYALAGPLTNSGAISVASGGVLDASTSGISSTGTLANDGTVSGATTVNGGMVTGTGTFATLNVNGGTFAPGNGVPGTSANVTGNLAFSSAASYLIQIDPSSASSVTVGGVATLGGAAVNAVFANGTYIAKQYTIVTASGGISGSFAAAPVTTNLPASFETNLSYDATHAYLNLALTFGLAGNQQAVGDALSGYFNRTGGIPLVYGMLTANGLAQASGELGTGSQQTTFSAMGQFMGILTDPFLSRGGLPASNAGAPAFAAGDEALGYAPWDQRRSVNAYAMLAKAPPRGISEPRWSVWGAGFGGAQSTDGNAAVGSNNATSNIYGTAIGADYRLSPFTTAGFALAGGGTNFRVSGFGSGRSDLFQAGAYLRHVDGPSYVSAALAYGWQDVTTDRTVTIAGIDRLHAEFNANAWSGRLEGGYRFVAPWLRGIGITPYAAGQFTTFDLPAYAESVVSGGGAFALAYGAKSVTDTRSELGLRADKSIAMADSIFTLRGRVAWAHDFNPDRSVAATFQALPGASFVVNGAAQAADSALTTAAAEIKWMNGWSAAAIFEGEFSNVTRSYAGKGTLRYVW